MAERLRHITVFMIIAYILYEGVAYFMALAGSEISMFIGIGAFAAVGAAAGYKAYDEMASNSDIVEVLGMFIIMMVVLSFLTSAFFYMLSVLMTAFSQGVSGGGLTGAAASSVDPNAFFRVLALIVFFVGTWFLLTLRGQSKPGA